MQFLDVFKDVAISFVGFEPELQEPQVSPQKISELSSHAELKTVAWCGNFTQEFGVELLPVLLNSVWWLQTRIRAVLIDCLSFQLYLWKTYHSIERSNNCSNIMCKN